MLPWWVFAIGSAVFVSFSVILAKKVLQKEHAMQFEATRILLTFLITLLFLPYVNFSFPLVILGLLILLGFFDTISAIYMSKTRRHMNISEVEPLKNISPALVVALAYLILGETPGALNLYGILLLLVGAYILEADHHLLNLKVPFKRIKDSKYLHYLFFVLLIWAFSAIVVKYTIDFVDPVSLLFFLVLFRAIFSISAISIIHDGFRDIKKALHIYGGTIFLTSILGVLASLAFLKAVSLAYVSLVIPIKRMSTLFATIIGGELFHEKGILIKSIACIIMIIGATLVIL